MTLSLPAAVLLVIIPACVLCIPTAPDQVAWFQHDAMGTGTVALAAHAHLAGVHFAALSLGDVAFLDGQAYRVTERIDLDDDPTPAQWFEIFGPAGRLVMQTCKDGGYTFAVGEQVQTWHSWLPEVMKGQTR